MNISFDLEDSPYKGCGFTVRFELVLKNAYLLIVYLLRDFYNSTVCAANDGVYASIVLCHTEGIS